jgi:hypothetical protein
VVDIVNVAFPFSAKSSFNVTQIMLMFGKCSSHHQSSSLVFRYFRS